MRLLHLVRSILTHFTQTLLGTRTSGSHPTRPAESPFDGDLVYIELEGIVLALHSVQLEDPCENMDDQPIGLGIDRETILFRRVNGEVAECTHYRDEDGEMRPLRTDRGGLSAMALEDVAAEFLHVKADVEAAPDEIERTFNAAIRDAYGRELWRRLIHGNVSIIAVGGRRYRIVQLPMTGSVTLVPVD